MCACVCECICHLECVFLVPFTHGVCYSSDLAKAIVTDTLMWIQLALPSYGGNLYFVDCRFLHPRVI